MTSNRLNLTIAAGLMALTIGSTAPTTAQALAETEMTNCLAVMYRTTHELIDIDAVRVYADKFPECKTTSPVVIKTEPSNPINAKTNCILNEIGYWQKVVDRTNSLLAQFMLKITTDAILEKCKL